MKGPETAKRSLAIVFEIGALFYASRDGEGGGVRFFLAANRFIQLASVVASGTLRDERYQLSRYR